MNWFVVEFEGRKAGQILEKDEATARKSISDCIPGAVIKSIKVNPYRCSGLDLIGGNGVDDWALCYTPGSCTGRTSCPKAYACSE